MGEKTNDKAQRSNVVPKVISLALAVFLVLGLIPAFALGNGGEQQIDPDNVVLEQEEGSDTTDEVGEIAVATSEYSVAFWVDGFVHDTINVAGYSAIEPGQIPRLPEIEGYRFVGWFSSDNEEFDFEKMQIVEDTNIFARYTETDGLEQEDQEAAILYPEPQAPWQSLAPNQATGDTRRRFTYARPNFVTDKTGLTSAERGTALHLALQYLDYKKCGSADGVSDELLRLSKKGLLTEEQAAVVETQKLMRFFESDIGKRVTGSGSVYREFKFSLLCPAERFFPGGGDDKVLLQGVVDCFFEEDGALTVVDFKTDYVTQETIEEKAKHYAPQLAAYSDALERITGKRVKERIIYFFALDTCFVL